MMQDDLQRIISNAVYDGFYEIAAKQAKELGITQEELYKLMADEAIQYRKAVNENCRVVDPT